MRKGRKLNKVYLFTSLIQARTNERTDGFYCHSNDSSLLVVMRTSEKSPSQWNEYSDFRHLISLFFSLVSLQIEMRDNVAEIVIPSNSILFPEIGSRLVNELDSRHLKLIYQISFQRNFICEMFFWHPSLIAFICISDSMLTRGNCLSCRPTMKPFNSFRWSSMIMKSTLLLL